MPRASRVLLAVLGASFVASFVAGCRRPIYFDRKPGVAPHCADRVCVEIVNFKPLRDTPLHSASRS